MLICEVITTRDIYGEAREAVLAVMAAFEGDDETVLREKVRRALQAIARRHGMRTFKVVVADYYHADERDIHGRFKVDYDRTPIIYIYGKNNYLTVQSARETPRFVAQMVAQTFAHEFMHYRQYVSSGHYLSYSDARLRGVENRDLDPKKERDRAFLYHMQNSEIAAHAADAVHDMLAHGADPQRLLKMLRKQKGIRELTYAAPSLMVYWNERKRWGERGRQVFREYLKQMVRQLIAASGDQFRTDQ